MLRAQVRGRAHDIRDMTISIGVLGAGLIGRKHLARIAADARFTLVGLAEDNSATAAAAAPGARVFAHWRTLLDEAKPDAVIVALPNQLHAEAGIACARRGVHFLMEKPVTDGAASAAALIAEVRRAGVRTLVGHHRRHHLQVARLREALARGTIGDLVGVSAMWAACKPDAYFAAAPWRAQPGGGPILINLVHEIDFLRFVAGEIVAVTAIAGRRRRGFPVEDTAAIALEFAGGALGTFLVSDAAVSPWTTEQGVGEAVEFPFSGESAYRFVGSAGAVEFPDLTLWTQAGAGNWNEPVRAQRLHATTIDPYAAQLAHFHDVIVGAAPSLQTVEDGARTLAATLAASEAAESGRRVDLAPRYAALTAPG